MGCRFSAVTASGEDISLPVVHLIVVLTQRQDGGDEVYMCTVYIGEDYMYYNVPEFTETYYYAG